MSYRRSFSIALAFVALALGAAACSSSPSATANRRSGQGAGSTSTTSAGRAQSAADAPIKVTYGTGSIGQPDPTTTIPNERGNVIQPVLAPGQNIILSAKGCMPQTLEANVSAPVVWTNLTKKPQRVIFEDFGVDSGTIPAGGTFTWSTDQAVAMSYRVVGFPKLCTLLMNPEQP